jgi:mono/diheme cytochrome c family protein
MRPQPSILALPALLALPLLGAGAEGAAGGGLTAKDLSAARSLYVAKCAKCHQFYEPKGYSDAEWRTWMEKMNRKSRLKPDQATLLNRYLDAYRRGDLPGKPQDRR